MSALAAVVDTAVEQLRAAFRHATVSVEDDGRGGAFVVVEPVELGPRYRPAQSWLGFHVSTAIPDADVYPLYIGGDVVRADGQPHTNPAIQSVRWRGRQALQLSRRSNRRDPAVNTPALKAVGVLAWFAGL